MQLIARTWLAYAAGLTGRPDEKPTGPLDSLTDIVASLVQLTGRDLMRLHFTVNQVQAVPPGLVAWVEHATDWELNRRAGFFYRLQGPLAAIDDTEIKRSLATLSVLSNCFGGDRQLHCMAIADFFQLVASVLRAEIEPPRTLH